MSKAAAAEKAPEPQAEGGERLHPEAYAEAARKWRAKAADLGEQMGLAQAELDKVEGEAAKAALEGREMPDTGAYESKLRALKRARQMAVEAAEQAEEGLAAAKRAEAKDAAAAVAVQLVAEASGLDDCLAELGHRTATVQRLGRRHAELMTAAGGRRRVSDGISPSALAGAIVHAAPEVFAALGAPRPTAAQRQPLAEALAQRHGLAPAIREVK